MVLTAVGLTLLLYHAYIFEVLYLPQGPHLLELPSEEVGYHSNKVWTKPRVPVVIGVVSSGRTQERRTLWRQTLLPILHRTMLQPGVDYALKFVLGKGLLPEEEEAVMEESARYGDIMRVDCVEAYVNLTCKTREACRTFVRDYDFGLLYKVDDDTFVRLDRLLPELIQRQNETALYEGQPLMGQPIPREGENGEKILLHNSEYLPYHSGSGYILSRDLASFIAHPPHELELKKFTAEDASVGLWLAPFDVKFRLREDFNPWGDKEGCPVGSTGPVALHYFPKEKWGKCAKRIIAGFWAPSVTSTPRTSHLGDENPAA